MTKETPVQKAIDEAVAPLKKALILCPKVKNIIIDKRQKKFLTVEHINGTVYSIYPRFYRSTNFIGYSLSQPIEPNQETGSWISLDCEDGSLSDVMDHIRQGRKFIPNFFNEREREVTKHQTWQAIRLSPFHRDDIQLKGEKPTDRELVNSCIRQDKSYKNSYLQEVAEEFVEEMRDSVPPAFMGKKGPFYYIQVGEITDHKRSITGEYIPVYETYTRVTEDGKNSPMTTAYAFGQWYFIGLKTQIK